MAPSGTANDTAASNQHNLLSPASATSNASSKSSRRSLQGLVKSFRRGKSKKRNNTTDSGSDNTPSMIEIGESPEKLLLPPESVDTDSTTSTSSSSIEQQRVLTKPPAAAGSTNPTESIASSQTNRSSSSTMASSKDVVIVKPIDDDDDTTTTTSLDLVVLLMHPVSHRFELVQLEFADGKKAKVSDLLGQIPVSVTEECLKSQLYDSILDQDSTDPGRPRVHGSTRLIEAFGGGGGENNSDGTTSRKMVLVARPQGITDHDALKMAKPIFTNKDILSMVRKKNETQKSIG